MYVLNETPVFPTGALQDGYRGLVVKKGTTTITNSSSQTISADTTFTTSATTNKVTVTIKKDGSNWNQSGVKLELRQSNTAKYNVTSNTANVATGEMNAVKNGTYDLFAGKSDSAKTTMVDTGIDIEVKDNDKTAEVNYYSLTLVKGTGISDVKSDGTSTTSAVAYMSNYSISIDATVTDGYTWNTWTKSSGTNLTTFTAGTKSQNVKMGAGAATLTASATYTATPSISRTDYNTFGVSATAGSKYLISKTQTTAPTASTSGWATTTSKDVSTSAKETWYVWVQDASGNVSANSATITNYKVTLTAGTGTTLSAKADTASGTNVTNGMYVLNETPVFPTGALQDGYRGLVVKKGTSTITNSSSQTINADTTFTTSATVNTVKVNVYNNGAAWAASGMKVTLYNGTTATSFTSTLSGSGVSQATFTGVPNGTYNVYAGKDSANKTTLIDSGVDVTVNNNDPAAVTVNYYSVTLKKGTAVTAVSNGGTANENAKQYLYITGGTQQNIAINATLESNATWVAWTKTSGTNPETFTAGTQSQNIKLGTGGVELTANAIAKPTINRTDFNTFTFSAAGAGAYYVSTSSTAPTVGASQTTFALNKWTTATTTGDLTLAAGTYYVWAESTTTGGTRSAVNSIAAVTITRSQGTGTTLTTRYDATTASNGTAYTDASKIVLSGTPFWASATVSDGYRGLALKHGSTTITTTGGTFNATASEAIASTATANTVTVTIKKDGSNWNQSGIKLELRQSNAVKYDVTSNTANVATGVMSAVKNGTYDLFAGKSNSAKATMADTGIDVTVNNNDKTAEVNYYSLTLAKGTGISDVKSDGTSTTSAVAYMSNYSIPIDATVTDGYTWSTWTKSSGTNLTTFTAGTKSQSVKMGAGSATLTASVTANTYTVVYNGNGNTGGSTASSSHTYNVEKALTTNGFTRAGYTFVEWSTSASDVAKLYDNTEYSGSCASDSTSYQNIKSYTVGPTFASGDVYQLDVDVKGSGTLRNYFHGASGYLRVANWTSPTTGNSGTNTDGCNTIPLTSSYTHYTVRFTLGSTGSGTVNKYLLFRAMPGCTASIKNVRFSKVSENSVAYVDGQSVKNLTTTPNGEVNLYAIWMDLTAPTVTAYAGTMLYTDPTFSSGVNGTKVYDNKKTGKTTVTRTQGTTPEGNYYLKILNTGSGTEPDLGGFYFANNAAKNKIFVTRIVAKIPVGYTINWASNKIGNEGTNVWKTSQAGTGDWQEYIHVTTCGSTGTFTTTSFFYLSGTAGTASAPVEWDVAYATVFDTTLWSNEQYVVSVASDAGSGITSYGMNQSNTSAPTYTTQTAKAYAGKVNKITANGTYYAWYKDSAGNTNKAAVTASYIDTTAPTLSSINVTSPETGIYTEDTTITLQATYSENVYNSSRGTLNSSTAPTLKLRFGSGTERTATFSSVNGTKINYTYTIQSGDNGVLSTTSYSGTVYDIALNSLTVSNKTVGGKTITADTTEPDLSSLNITSPATGTYKAGQVVTMVATFSEDVINTSTSQPFTTSNVPDLKVSFDGVVAKGNSGKATCTAVTSSTMTYQYTITAGDNGVLGIKQFNWDVGDGAGNGASGAYAIDTQGQSSFGGNRITADTTVPTCTITASPDGTSTAPTNASSITYTFTWSETLANNTFTTDDIVVTNGTKGTFGTTTANKVYTLVVTNSGSCTQTVSVAASKCTDAVGNNNTAASKSVIIDRTAPTLSTINVTNPATGKYKADDVVTIVATYSENVYGNTSKAKITSTTAPTLKIKFGSSTERTATFSNASGATVTYTYKIQTGDNGTLAVTGHSGTVYDVAGNSLSVGTKTIGGNTITADTIAPVYDGYKYGILTMQQTQANAVGVTSNYASLSWDVCVGVTENDFSGYCLTTSSSAGTYTTASLSSGKLTINGVKYGTQYNLFLKDTAGNITKATLKLTGIAISQSTEGSGTSAQVTYVLYETLQKALGTGTSSSAHENGSVSGNITLLQDINNERVVNKRTDKTMTVSMAGKIIEVSGVYDDTGMYCSLVNLGKLTLNGTSSSTGTVGALGQILIGGIYNTGTLTLTYMTILGTDDNSYPVYNQGGTVTINSSTVTGDEIGAVYTNKGTVTITSSSVTGTSNKAIEVKGSTVTIDGTSDVGSSSNPAIDISGITGSTNYNSNVTIKGSSQIGSQGDSGDMITVGVNSTLTVTGSSTITSSGANGIVTSANGTLNINGGTIVANSGNAVKLTDGSSFTISAGTIMHKGSATNSAIYDYRSATLNIAGGTVVSENGAAIRIGYSSGQKVINLSGIAKVLANRISGRVIYAYSSTHKTNINIANSARIYYKKNGTFTNCTFASTVKTSTDTTTTNVGTTNYSNMYYKYYQ